MRRTLDHGIAAQKLVDDAQERLENKIIHEPRVFFDAINLGQPGAGVDLFSHGDDTFRNGEQFPITLTHATFYFSERLAGKTTPDEARMFQATRARMQYHQQMYMNDQLLPIPLWANKVVGTMECTAYLAQSWNFAQYDKCPILQARDAIEVDVSFRRENDIPDRTYVTVACHGIGMLSMRPYLLTSQALRAAATSQDLAVIGGMQTRDIRNDGSEPILITDLVTHFVVAGAADDVPTSFPRDFINLNFRQSGSGTNALWCKGPSVEPSALALLPNNDMNRVPFFNLGVTTGRAVVHKFPEPLVWKPGDGLDNMTFRTDNATASGHIINVALTGYITVS